MNETNDVLFFGTAYRPIVDQLQKKNCWCKNCVLFANVFENI